MGRNDDIEEIFGAPGKSATGKSASGGQVSKSLKVVFKKKSVSSSGDQHTGGRPLVGSRPSGSSIAPDQSRLAEKRPIEDVDVEALENIPAADPKRARVTSEVPTALQILERGSVSAQEMINLLFKFVPPATYLPSETTQYVMEQYIHGLSLVAHAGSELVIRSRTSEINQEEELKMLREKMMGLETRVKELESEVESSREYPGSDQSLWDAAVNFASRPTALPVLVSSLCKSEDAALPLFQELHRDPVGLQMLRKAISWGFSRGKEVMQQKIHQALEEALEDWGQVRTVLPEDVPSPGPEPFSDPPAGPSDPPAAASRTQKS